MKKLLIDLLIALLAKLAGYFVTQYKTFKKNKKTVKEQDKKTQDITNAEIKRDIETAHRNNHL
jgi:uncharacterized membrane protein (DUF106 family)